MNFLALALKESDPSTSYQTVGERKVSNGFARGRRRKILC
jgi:hypothetical protein